MRRHVPGRRRGGGVGWWWWVLVLLRITAFLLLAIVVLETSASASVSVVVAPDPEILPTSSSLSSTITAVPVPSESWWWSPTCPPPRSLFPKAAAAAVDPDNSFTGAATAPPPRRCCCAITDYGAVGDNTTLNTRAIQTTIKTCHTLCRRRPHPESEDSEGTSIVYVPAGFYQTGSIVLSVSNTRLHLGRGGALYGSDDPQHYPLVPLVPPTPPQPPTPPTPPTQQQPGAAGTILHQPPMMMYRPLLYGYHVHNIAITGENRGYPPGAFAHFSSQTATEDDDADESKSIIDGVGWKWWCKSRSMPIPQAYCHQMNPTNATLPPHVFRPKLMEFYNVTNLVLDKVTARNSPTWFIHPILSQNIAITNVTVLAPRSVGNTDGIDPDSSENVIIDSCYIDVGDDGISIKSSNHSHGMVPTRNITMRNLRIVSRNWCIGSATFGGIYDILFEDSTIGDPDTITSPWAIKFKSHRNFPGPMENITIRRIEMGRIGPTPYMFPKVPGKVFEIHLAYGESPSNHPAGKPIFRNVTFEDITVVSAGVPGTIEGFSNDCLEHLTLKNITIGSNEEDNGRGRGIAVSKNNWTCRYINLKSLTVSDVYPPVSCTDGCIVSGSSTGLPTETEILFG